MNIKNTISQLAKQHKLTIKKDLMEKCKKMGIIFPTAIKHKILNKEMCLEYK